MVRLGCGQCNVPKLDDVQPYAFVELPEVARVTRDDGSARAQGHDSDVSVHRVRRPCAPEQHTNGSGRRRVEADDVNVPRAQQAGKSGLPRVAPSLSNYSRRDENALLGTTDAIQQSQQPPVASFQGDEGTRVERDAHALLRRRRGLAAVPLRTASAQA